MSWCSLTLPRRTGSRRRGRRDRGFDLRSTALLFSTAGAAPLPLLGFVEPSLIRPNGMPWFLAVWAYTLVSLGIVLARRPIGDRCFVVLSTGGMLGIGLSAYLMTDVTSGHVILCLLAAIPAMAAMHSRGRIVVGFLVGALLIVTAYCAMNPTGVLEMLVRVGATTMAIGFPTLLVTGLRRSLEKALSAQREMSNTDPLTGLLNRRGLRTRAGQLIADAARQHRGLGFLALDIDNFKAINDVHGHTAGDRVLTRTAQIIAAHGGQDATSARLGGEEFAVLMLVDDLDALVATAETIRTAVAADRSVTISIGAVFGSIPVPHVDGGDADGAPWHAAFVDELAAVADLNLYRAKQEGRDRVHANPTSVLGVAAEYRRRA